MFHNGWLGAVWQPMSSVMWSFLSLWMGGLGESGRKVPLLVFAASPMASTALRRGPGLNYYQDREVRKVLFNTDARRHAKWAGSAWKGRCWVQDQYSQQGAT